MSRIAICDHSLGTTGTNLFYQDPCAGYRRPRPSSLSQWHPQWLSRGTDFPAVSVVWNQSTGSHNTGGLVVSPGFSFFIGGPGSSGESALHGAVASGVKCNAVSVQPFFLPSNRVCPGLWGAGERFSPTSVLKDSLSGVLFSKVFVPLVRGSRNNLCHHLGQI